MAIDDQDYDEYLADLTLSEDDYFQIDLDISTRLGGNASSPTPPLDQASTPREGTVHVSQGQPTPGIANSSAESKETSRNLNGLLPSSQAIAKRVGGNTQVNGHRAGAAPAAVHGVTVPPEPEIKPHALPTTLAPILASTGEVAIWRSTNGRAAKPNSQDPPRRKGKSLLQLYRWRGGLSVTDLIRPQWCEVKLDYSLRGNRRLGVNMPDIIVSKHGKEIKVQKDVVKRVDAVMAKGTAVHAKLEKEIPMIEVAVAATTAEERFALEMLNVLSNLQNLFTLGFCRELKVWGFIGDQHVRGIIDEVVRKPIAEPFPSSTPAPNPSLYKRPLSTTSTPVKLRPKRQKSGNTPAPSPSLARFFPITPEKKKKKKSSPARPGENDDPFAFGSPKRGNSAWSPRRFTPQKYRLYLNDTKTRETGSIPRYKDEAGMLQLMLYRKLLLPFVTPPPNPALLREPVVASPLTFFPPGFPEPTPLTAQLLETDAATVVAPSPSPYPSANCSQEIDVSPESTQSQATTAYYTAFSSFSTPAGSQTVETSAASQEPVPNPPERSFSYPELSAQPPSATTQPPESLSFDRLFKHYGLNPRRQFSDRFTLDASVLFGGVAEEEERTGWQYSPGSPEPKDWMSMVLGDGDEVGGAVNGTSSGYGISCLEDVVECWWTTVESLNLASVLDERRPRSSGVDKGKGAARPRSTSPVLNGESEGLDLCPEDEDDSSSGPVSEYLELVYRSRHLVKHTGSNRRSSKGDGVEKAGGRQRLDRGAGSGAAPIDKIKVEVVDHAIFRMGRGEMKSDLQDALKAAAAIRELARAALADLDGQVGRSAEGVAVVSRKGRTHSRVSSAGSELLWQDAFGDGYLKDEDYMAVDLNALDRPVLKGGGRKEMEVELTLNSEEEESDGDRREGASTLGGVTGDAGRTSGTPDAVVPTASVDDMVVDGGSELAAARGRLTEAIDGGSRRMEGGDRKALDEDDGVSSKAKKGWAAHESEAMAGRGSRTTEKKPGGISSMDQSEHKQKQGSTAAGTRDSEMGDAGGIIGRTRFRYEEEKLERYLSSALEFWEGKREPRGVDLEDTWRCESCEYKNDCEWRAARAEEFASRRGG